MSTSAVTLRWPQRANARPSTPVSSPSVHAAHDAAEKRPQRSLASHLTGDALVVRRRHRREMRPFSGAPVSAETSRAMP
jgi:hypothetical protein